MNRKLMAQITLKNMTVNALAKAIGVAKCTLYRKIKGITQFTHQDIERISSVLNLTKDEMCDIFFDKKVS